ncbi:UDP-2,3-diacylglucosamine diphosphatase [Enterobacteriaceae bacterium LUAb1]
MGHTLFIADLHLCQQQPAITAGFLRFLQHDAIHADALYILGDLFETWIGDDDPEPLHQQIACALKSIVNTGIPIYFIHGNRDFLLGYDYARTSGMTLLPEEQVVELYGQRILILHGDTLCIDDINYQRFRHQVHQRWLQKLFLSLPLRCRQRIATRMRAGSKTANRYKSLKIMDVNAGAVEQALLRQRVHLMIHGHTHRPAIHYDHIQGIATERLVPGAWHDEGSVIKISPEGRELIFFPL